MRILLVVMAGVLLSLLLKAGLPFPRRAPMPASVSGNSFASAFITTSADACASSMLTPGFIRANTCIVLALRLW